MGMSRLLRLALVQMHVGANKSVNLTNAKEAVGKAVTNGAQIVCLPECFNSPYGTQYFAEYAETIPGETSNFLSQVAKDAKVWLFGGSIPEKADDGKLRNTSMVFSPNGDLVARFSKVHLFDIDVPGKITFQESKILSPGSDLMTVDVGDCRVGVGICYDCRFAELAQIYAQKGCHLLLYPGAFSMTTGPLHWELLARARATDNQLFVGFCSPARDTKASYVAWGHSLIVSPWGEVMASAKEDETIVFADIDLQKVDEVRQQIPIRNQRRFDIYEAPKSLR